jgi:ribose-phosphate pyrophosphokinase
MAATSIDPSTARFFAGSSHPRLAEDVARYLGLSLGASSIQRFSNDNLYIQLYGSMRSRVVYILQSLTPPVQEHLMELFMMLDIARAAAAREVHAIIPYFSYARSDKKDAPRISITARLVADLLETAGASHVMTMMFHSPQVHGFFSVPTDPLTARPVFNRYYREQDLSDTIVVAPDAGGAKSASRFAQGLGLPVAAANKDRISDTDVVVAGLVGRQVRGFRRALVFDDEIATGGSVVEVSRVLVDNGIEEIDVVCTHGVFVANALERLGSVPQIRQVVCTDTVPIDEGKRTPLLKVLSIAPIFGEAILSNYCCRSIGSLFDFGEAPEDSEDFDEL